MRPDDLEHFGPVVRMDLRPHIEKLCDNIDAAVFTGDQFMEAPARARLRFFMARWEEELKSFGAIDSEASENCDKT